MVNVKKSVFDTPVLLIGFNRPDSTLLVIEALRAIGARNIYFSVDGPRINSESDIVRVKKVRELAAKFDWGCELKIKFETENLGLMKSVSKSISWFFENELEGIILEDDCVPTSDFFNFAQSMLKKYRNNPSVMHISGSPYFISTPKYDFNHFLSTLPSVWGWATWRNSWSCFDLTMKNLDNKDEYEVFLNYFKSKKIANWFIRYFEEAKSPLSKVWSAQWMYAMIQKNAYAIVPIKGLVQYIGSDPESTHGQAKSMKLYDNYPIEFLPKFPDPEELKVNTELIANQFRFIRKTDVNLQLTRRFYLSFKSIIARLIPRRLRKKLKSLRFLVGALNR